MSEFEFSNTLEQLEDGVELESFEQKHEITDEWNGDLVYGRIDFLSQFDGAKDVIPLSEVSGLGLDEQLCYMHIIKELSFRADILPSVCGISRIDLEYLLSLQPQNIEKIDRASLSELTDAMDQGCKVICSIHNFSIDSSAMWNHDTGSSYYAVVQGIDLRSLEAPRAYLDILGKEPVRVCCPLDVFVKTKGCSYIIDGA